MCVTIQKIYIFRTFGCLPPDEAGLMQCKANLVPHLNPKKIACCSDEDFCNQKLTPMYDLVQPNTNSDDSFLVVPSHTKE